MKLIHTIIVAVVLGLTLGLPALGMDNPECFDCHGKVDIKAETEKGKDLVLYRSEDLYADSRHGSVPCTECHRPDVPEGFETVPHRLVAEQQTDCGDCHGRYFNAITTAFADDIHRQHMPEGFMCRSCHDSHQVVYLTDSKPAPTPVDKTAYSNPFCLECHLTEITSPEVTVRGLAAAHTSLVAVDLHLASLRCVDCHTDMDDPTNHRVLAKSDTVSCTACHTMNTLLVRKLYQPASPVSAEYSLLNRGLINDTVLIKRITDAGGHFPETSAIVHDADDWRFTNQPVADHVYVIGATRHKQTDRIFFGVFLGTAGLVLLHLIIRLLVRPRRGKESAAIVEEYVNSRQVRIWHWTNALLVLLLMVSGYSIHFVRRGAWLLDFAWSIKLHDIAGILLLIGYLIFLVSGIADGNLKNYLPGSPGFWRRCSTQLRFYLWGILKGEQHPFHPHIDQKFNPLQKLIYTCLMGLVFPALIISGLLLMFPSLLPGEYFGESGKWLAVLIHSISAGTMVIFLLIHLYLLTTGDRLSFLIRSMITGYHRSLDSGR